MILDKIDTLRLNNPSLPTPDPKVTWSRREEVARQMLHVLHSFSDEPLEPNGYHTVSSTILFAANHIYMATS
jgi:hypothetical protein